MKTKVIELVKDDFIFGVERENSAIDTHSPSSRIWFYRRPESLRSFV
jgi:hypothetical protein